MKYFTFYSELNNFDDILKDTEIKKNLKLKITWQNYLMIGLKNDVCDSLISIMTLKYGEMMVNNLTKDFTPVPYIDYTPKKDKNLFKQKQS